MKKNTVASVAMNAHCLRNGIQIPNEYTAAEKYAASLIGKEMAVIPEKKRTGKVSRDVLESAGDMAKAISPNRQTGANGQELQITGRETI